MDHRGEERGGARAGLVALGLIMELVGSVVAAYLIVQALESFLGGRAFPAWYLTGYWYDVTSHRVESASAPTWRLGIVAGVAILRALLHRRAGSAVLYRPERAVGAVTAYVAVALSHTVFCAVEFALDLDGRSLEWMVITGISIGWPIALLLAIRRPTFRRLLRVGPAACSVGATAQVGTLMAFLGLVGAFVSLFALYAALDSAPVWSLSSSLLVALTGLLCVRSLVHIRVGFRLAGRGTGSNPSWDWSSYVKVGLVTSALAWGLILVLLSLLLRRPPSGYPSSGFRELTEGGMVVYLLFLWPLLLRRLERTRAAAQVAERRPRESAGGLAALAWLLLAGGAVQVGLVLASALLGEVGATSFWARLIEAQVGGFRVPRGPGLQLLIALPQIWVAIELLRGSPLRGASATLYAACASIATVISIQDDMRYLMRAIANGLSQPKMLLGYLPIGFALLVPIAALVFVQHHLRREGAPSRVVSSPEGE